MYPVEIRSPRGCRSHRCWKQGEDKRGYRIGSRNREEPLKGSLAHSLSSGTEWVSGETSGWFNCEVPLKNLSADACRRRQGRFSSAAGIMTTVAIATLGCKVNQFESEALMDSLERTGIPPCPFWRTGGYHHHQYLHRHPPRGLSIAADGPEGLPFQPGSLLIVTGCGADVDPERMAEIQGVTHVLGNVEKSHLHEILPLIRQRRIPDDPRFRYSERRPSSRNPSSFFPQAYTGVPQDSGRMRLPLFLLHRPSCQGAIEKSPARQGRGHPAGHLKKRGYKEVVLTGIHIGAYGRDLVPPVPLEKLLEHAGTRRSPFPDSIEFGGAARFFPRAHLDPLPIVEGLPPPSHPDPERG